MTLATDILYRLCNGLGRCVYSLKWLCYVSSMIEVEIELVIIFFVCLNAYFCSTNVC